MAVSAHNGGVVIKPELQGVNVNGDLNISVNNKYVHSSSTGDETDVSPKTKENLQSCRDKLRDYLKTKTNLLFQGPKTIGSSALLKMIYTELYLTEGRSDAVNSEVYQGSAAGMRKVHLNSIFEPFSHRESPPQRVLTQGIAGIGKTVAVQKFTHDWAEGTANQSIQLIFPFSFRDLNLIRNPRLSLVELVGQHFEEVKDLKTSDYNSSNVLFIFDGLDESRLPLEFDKNEICRSVTKSTTVDALLTNLIKGNLLSKALVWITSRPAAASRIPPQFIDRVTEVRGFTDEQKEEYFTKKVRDVDAAQKILDHLQSKPLRSLYVMCHIPVFCWITATVFQSLFQDAEKQEPPKTVTEMYTHYLIIQTKRNHEKDYQRDSREKDEIMKLGKLAFEQLRKANLIFYEKALAECGIDVKQAAVYSGICTQITRKESGLYPQDCYTFIHLSVQEFLAALYVLETFIDCGKNVFLKKVKVGQEQGDIATLHSSAIKEALALEHSRWDLFLRFLLGLSQKNNQLLLHTEFGFKQSLPQSNKKTISTIYREINKSSSHDEHVHLYECLIELGHSLLKQVQKSQSSANAAKLTAAHLSALACELLHSDEDLDVFDLRKYCRSDEAVEKLLALLKLSKTALLSDCGLTERCCGFVSQVLSSKMCRLQELDLSRNDLQDSAVSLLCDGLKDPNCKLRTLGLSGCNLSERSCEALASVLSSQFSKLKDLNLSNNNLQDSGVKLLSAGLKTESCTLETIRLSSCLLTADGFAYLASALRSNSCSLRELDLSYNQLEDLGVKSDWLSLCKLDILRLSSCNLSRRNCEALVPVLSSQSCSLKELDLSDNNLHDSGVALISAGLESPHCALKTLRLSGCMITEKGCASLASALSSKPSNLRVLDLSYNHPGPSGVKLLSARLQKWSLATLSDHSGEQRLKPDLRKWVCKLTLDMNTVHKNLDVSDGKVTTVVKKQQRPPHPDRFDRWHQLLCEDAVAARCYWEVEWKGKVCLAVAHGGIERKGQSLSSNFGSNNQSWSLCCSDNGEYSVRHDNVHMSTPLTRVSNRAAVYVDCPAGTLSFYSVCSDELIHLHTFHSVFTEPLYPGFWLGPGSSVVLC